MRVELKDLLIEVKAKIKDSDRFHIFLGEILNEANYNNYYGEPIATQEVAEQLVEVYFVENLTEEEKQQLIDVIMKILFYLEGDEKFTKSYEQYMEATIKPLLKEFG